MLSPKQCTRARNLDRLFTPSSRRIANNKLESLDTSMERNFLLQCAGKGTDDEQTVSCGDFPSFAPARSSPLIAPHAYSQTNSSVLCRFIRSFVRACVRRSLVSLSCPEFRQLLLRYDTDPIVDAFLRGENAPRRGGGGR